MRLVIPGQPMSVNAAYFNRRPGTRGRGRVKTDEYRRFQRAAEFAANQAKSQMVIGPVVVRLLNVFKTMGSDIDGPIKPTLDVLQLLGLFENDNRVMELHVFKQKNPDNPRTEIEILPWVPGPREAA